MAAVAAAERPPMMALELPVGPEVSDVDAMVQRLRTPRSVDEQVKESADKLCETKAWQKRVDEEVGCLETMPTLQSTSQWHPCSKRPGDSFHWLKLLQDPQFLELCEKAEKELTPEEEEAPLRLDWRRHCRRGIRALLEQLRLTQDPKVAERQLRAAHRWYQLQAGAFSTSHSTADTRAEKSGRRPPSPCFHDPPALDVTLMPGSTRYCAPETAGGLASPSAQPSGRSRPALPSARDRLKCFETRQLVGPPSARRGKAGSCWDGTSERADTPSTSAGGYTARSFPSARTSSRPASAVSLRPPLSARAGPASRPRTASGLRAHSSFESDSFIREPPTPEELRMEERWLAARNREVVEQIAGEERRAALRDWSERRARVEEEIARNHEVARFQSDLPRRGYELPADAHEDIDLALGAAERGGGGRRPPAAPELSAEPSAGSSVSSGGGEPAEAQSREDLQVRFAEEPEVAVAGEEGLVPQQPPARPALTPRLAQLRRIHARYLQRPQGGAAQLGHEEGQEEAAPPSVGEESQPEPLSTHAAGRPEDGSDVVAAVCERWRESHAPELLVESGSSMTHRQMRYQQLMEVEQVKRAFTRRQTPLDEAALESALVAPSRGLCADATPMSTGPGGMRNPFAERHGKKKPKAKRRRKSTGKGSASSRSPPAGPRRARSAKR